MRSLLCAAVCLFPLLVGCDQRAPSDRAREDRDELLLKHWAASARNPPALGGVPQAPDWPGTPLPSAPWVFAADRPGTLVMPSPDWRRLDAVWRAPVGTPDPLPSLRAAATGWTPDSGDVLIRGRERLRFSRTPQGDLRIEQWEAQP